MKRMKDRRVRIVVLAVLTVVLLFLALLTAVLPVIGAEMQVDVRGTATPTPPPGISFGLEPGQSADILCASGAWTFEIVEPGWARVTCGEGQQ